MVTVKSFWSELIVVKTFIRSLIFSVPWAMVSVSMSEGKWEFVAGTDRVIENVSVSASWISVSGSEVGVVLLAINNWKVWVSLISVIVSICLLFVVVISVVVSISFVVVVVILLLSVVIVIIAIVSIVHKVG